MNKMTSVTALCSALALLLAGCSLASRYERPAVPLATGYPRGAQPVNAPQVTVADLGWKQAPAPDPDRPGQQPGPATGRAQCAARPGSVPHRAGCAVAYPQRRTAAEQGAPITLDGYAASHRAVREIKTDELLPEETTLRSSKYVNNLIEQDHRNIKSRVNAMLGFKRFRNAAVTIAICTRAAALLCTARTASSTFPASTGEIR